MKKDTNTNHDSVADDVDCDSAAEAVRKKYLYRRMVMHGKAKIPARLAMKMVGPDCAFHLYRNHNGEGTSS